MTDKYDYEYFNIESKQQKNQEIGNISNIYRENNMIEPITLESSTESSEYDYKSFEIRRKLEGISNIAHMGEIVVSSKEKSIIGTTALDTCIGIVFYDRKNKFGMVGHATSSTRTVIADKMFKMLGSEPRIIEYAIVNGYRNLEKNDYSGENQILEFLENNCPDNIQLVNFQSDLGVQVCSNVLAYEFAFEVTTATSVSQYLYYDGKRPNNGKNR